MLNTRYNPNDGSATRMFAVSLRTRGAGRACLMILRRNSDGSVAKSVKSGPVSVDVEELRRVRLDRRRSKSVAMSDSTSVRLWRIVSAGMGHFVY